MEPDETGAEPWYRIVVARERGDTMTRSLSDDSATLLRATGASVVITESLDVTPPADGALLVVAQGADVGELERLAPHFEGRAVALAVVAESTPEGSAVAHRLRRAYRAAKAFVLARQLVVPRSAFNVYGLTDEAYRERLEGILELLAFDTDRLLAKRTGWEEPGVVRETEWLGPHSRVEVDDD